LIRSHDPEAGRRVARVQPADACACRSLAQVVPDPGELLLLRLDAIQAAIEARQDLRPEEKEHATRALKELKHFLRCLPPGIVVEVASTFFRGCSEPSRAGLSTHLPGAARIPSKRLEEAG
jgi:hypothetical protein